MRPLLLDLFCGAGGASVGYHRAGFDVIGVDIETQPRYPFEFLRLDALEALHMPSLLRAVDVIHASPPCQFHSAMTECRPGLAEEYPDLIGPVRELIQHTGRPYVIENVPRSPLRDPVTLCGQMFGLELYRHRLFESNWPLWQIEHPEHVMPASKAGHWKPGTVMSVAGHVSPIAKAREVMGIDWMTRDELAESIPPAYSQSHRGAVTRLHGGRSMSANKARGTRAETAVVDYLRTRGATNAERRALRGKHDRGDVTGLPSVCIEVKDCARITLSEFVDEAEREGSNAPVPDMVAAAWIKRRGKGSPADWYVAMTGAQFVTLLVEAGYIPRELP